MTRIATMAVLILGLVGCADPPVVVPGNGHGTAVTPLRPALFGRALARVAGPEEPLPRGSGADGRVGDIVLENALVLFVIAGRDRAALGGPGGNVVDAVVAGGTDRMRLLSPLVGWAAAVPVVYKTVDVVSAGGDDVPAIAQARGHMAGRSDVAVATTYTLKPDDDALDIVTEVTNNSANALSGFGLSDSLCHGRSFRFSPQGGLVPRGPSGGGRFIAFFDEECSWGLVCGQGAGYEASFFEPGVSRLAYPPSDLGQGSTFAWRRSLVAVPGGPERIWQRAHMHAGTAPARLRFALVTEGGGVAVPRYEVAIAGADSGVPLVAVAGRSGTVDVDVPPGLYELAARSPGCPPWGPVSAEAEALTTHVFPVRFAPPMALKVSLSAEIDGAVGPTSARIVDYLLSLHGATDPPALPFPIWPPRGVKLSTGAREVAIPLAPGGVDTMANHLVTVSRGPLFDVQSARLHARPGQEQSLSTVLRRTVDPGDYVSVDFRQHDNCSPESPLTPGERFAANLCEGVDLGLIAVPPGSRRHLGEDVGGNAERALRLDLPGQGLFTVWPARPDPRSETALQAASGACRGVHETLSAVRNAYPGARLTAHHPFEPGRGVLALSGWTDPRSEPPAGLEIGFDAIELLTGRDVAAARRRMEAWFSLLNRGHMLMAVGASGSRGIFGDEAGVARTFLRMGKRDRSNGDALLSVAGRKWAGVPDSFVTNGPFVEAWLDGHSLGSLQQRRPGDSELRVRVRAAAWISIEHVAVYRNGRLVRRFDAADNADVLRLDETFDVSVPGDCWFVVVAEGTRPMVAAYGADAPEAFAVTNPIWVDADGDGRIRPGSLYGSF